MTTYWPVTWIDRMGNERMLDVGSALQATAIALALCESGRKAVVVHDSYQVEPDAEIMARIKLRVFGATIGAEVDQLLREATVAR